MGKNKGLILKIWMWVTVVFVGLGIGGLFSSGSAILYPILSWFPLWIHQLVGWGIIISVVIGAVLDLMK